MNRHRRRVATVVTALALALGNASAVHAVATPDSRLCAATANPAACAAAEQLIWDTADQMVAKMTASQRTAFCGSATCDLHTWVATNLAGPSRASSVCVLDTTCNVIPMIGSMLDRVRADELANLPGGDKLAPTISDLYTRLDEVVTLVTSPMQFEISGLSPEQIAAVIGFLTGGPSVPESLGDLNTLAATRNVSGGTVRTYGTQNSVELTSYAAKVPAGCTANLVFGTPFFFKRKAIFAYTVHFHYGQHLDLFEVVDRRGAGPFVHECPPTSVQLDMTVSAEFRPSPLDPEEDMASSGAGHSVTARAHQPYVNCYDPKLCTVVVVETDYAHGVLGCCLNAPPGAPYFWHVGDYDVLLKHEWQLTHGYNSYLYTNDVEDGYIGNTYNQRCTWRSVAFDPSVPNGCIGDG